MSRCRRAPCKLWSINLRRCCAEFDEAADSVTFADTTGDVVGIADAARACADLTLGSAASPPLPPTRRTSTSPRSAARSVRWTPSHRRPQHHARRLRPADIDQSAPSATARRCHAEAVTVDGANLRLIPSKLIQRRRRGHAELDDGSDRVTPIPNRARADKSATRPSSMAPVASRCRSLRL